MKRILAILCAMACLFALALPAMAANTITVTAYVPADWNEANVYVWNDAGNNGDWPGSAMTKVEAGVFTLDIPTGYPNIIINGQGVQTADLKMSGEADVWIVFDGTNGSGSAFDSDPGKGAVSGGNTGNTGNTGSNTGDINELSIAGSGIPGVGEWAPGDANGKMTANGNVYTITLGMPAGTSIKFKFCANGDWSSGIDFGGTAADITVTAGTPVELADKGSDLSYTASQDCNATFTVDLGAKTLTITEKAGTPDAPKPAPIEYPENLYMSGAGIPGASGDWVEKDDAMVLSGKDGVYTIALDVTAGAAFEFKFTNGSWSTNFGGEAAGVVVADNADVTLKSGGENLSYTAAADGTVTFTVDLTKNTLKVTAGNTVITPEPNPGDDGNTTGDNNKDEATEPTTAETTGTQEEKKDNSTLIIILAIVGVIAAGTAVAVVLILKKK